jgi:hypothetical protein
MTSFLTDYQPPGNNKSTLEKVEILFKKIEVLLLEECADDPFRSHVLMRLLESAMMAKECVKRQQSTDEALLAVLEEQKAPSSEGASDVRFG